MRTNSNWRGLRAVKQTVLLTGGLLACLALLTGCADKPTFDVDYDQSFAFSDFKTYRWYDDDHNSRESVPARPAVTRVRNTADQELMQRGFRQGARGQADFWVNTTTKRQTRKLAARNRACMAASLPAPTVAQ